MEIGLYDVLDQAQMESHSVAADVYDEHIRGAQEAEQMGYRYYFSIEHQTSDVSFLSAPSVYLTALARATSAMRFGVMIYQLPFHHPIRLAEDVAMLDHLSRGRVEFGAGTGVTSHEFLRWKVDFDRRRDISQEALDVILQAWTKDSVTYDGEFFQFDEVLTTPKPFQQPHPPVWFGCHSAASFEYAAQQNFHVSQNIDTDQVIAAGQSRLILVRGKIPGSSSSGSLTSPENGQLQHKGREFQRVGGLSITFKPQTRANVISD